MGISLSNNRRRTYNYGAYHPHPPPHYPPPYHYPADHPVLPPPLPPPQNPQFAAPSYAPPPPGPAYCNHPVGYSSCGYAANPMMGRFNYHSQYTHMPSGGWPVGRPLPPPMPPHPPPPYVEHQSARKVKNVVNVHKDTVRIHVDELNRDHHLISFVFDALHDGSITLFYFAKEEPNCRFVPTFPEAHNPVKFSFQKGLGQKFCQPPGSGIDLGFFELDNLSKPLPEEDVFPLVISAETYLQPHLADDHHGDLVPYASSHMQITQAVLEKNGNDPFQVRVVRQILWVDGVRYELREIYGLGSSSAEGYSDTDPGNCVICMSEPKDTAALPCRHMCMCSDCAKELRLQSNKCPICRQAIEELIEIKINSGYS